MNLITKKELIEFMNLFHEDNDSTYKSIDKGIDTIAYISQSYAGILFIVNDNKSFNSNVEERSDVEICKIFKEFTKNNSFKHKRDLQEYLEIKDVRGFVANGYFLFKGLESFKWNPYTARRDLRDFKEAILRAGAKHQDIHNNFVDFGLKADFNGEILGTLPHGGYVGRVSHREEDRFVVFDSKGKCYDIYPNNPELIQWQRYDLDRI